MKNPIRYLVKKIFYVNKKARKSQVEIVYQALRCLNEEFVVKCTNSIKDEYWINSEAPFISVTKEKPIFDMSKSFYYDINLPRVPITDVIISSRGDHVPTQCYHFSATEILKDIPKKSNYNMIEICCNIILKYRYVLDHHLQQGAQNARDEIIRIMIDAILYTHQYLRNGDKYGKKEKK